MDGTGMGFFTAVGNKIFTSHFIKPELSFLHLSLSSVTQRWSQNQSDATSVDIYIYIWRLKFLRLAWRCTDTRDSKRTKQLRKLETSFPALTLTAKGTWKDAIPKRKVIFQPSTRWWWLKSFLSSPRNLGFRWNHFDEHIFQVGWFNHQAPINFPGAFGWPEVPSSSFMIQGRRVSTRVSGRRSRSLNKKKRPEEVMFGRWPCFFCFWGSDFWLKIQIVNCLF